MSVDILPCFGIVQHPAHHWNFWTFQSGSQFLPHSGVLVKESPEICQHPLYQLFEWKVDFFVCVSVLLPLK